MKRYVKRVTAILIFAIKSITKHGVNLIYPLIPIKISIEVCKKSQNLRINYITRGSLKPAYFLLEITDLQTNAANPNECPAIETKLITFFVTPNELENSEYTIISQDLPGEEHQTFFTLNLGGATIKKSASELMCDKNILNKLSKEDISTIAYAAGFEYFDSLKKKI